MADLSSLTPVDRTLVMGVVNVTPDSFSDGGQHLDAQVAIARGQELVEDGADLVDVGGESTRPGAARVSSAEELRRVLPVIRGLTERGIAVGVDTMRARVAHEAVAAGAVLVNDVSGGLADRQMLSTVAQLRVPIVLMHWRAHSVRMQDLAHYDDVVTDVVTALAQRFDAAVEAGIDPAQVVLDPGLGFAKNADHNWALLHHLDKLVALGQPVLVGASRKRFLGELLANDAGEQRPVSDRDVASAAVSAIAAHCGAWGVRVHDARTSRDAVEVARAWQAGSSV